MTVLAVMPGKKPVKTELDGSLESMQEFVGGTIQAIYPSMEDPIALICNDEGKLLGLPWNRPLFDEDGNLYDIIAGTFFVVGLTKDDFGPLSPELIRKYTAVFDTVFLI